MEAIGIIFFACLAFAVAILILITCCFLKVNGGKNPNDLEKSTDTNDTLDRIRQMAYKKPDDGKITNHNQNVILFLHKKHNSNAATLPKQSLERNNPNRRIVDGNDVMDEGYQNGDDHQNDRGQTEQCNNSSSHIQATSCQPNHEISSNHGQVTSHHHDTSSQNTGITHLNDGFSSHFGSSHHDSSWGHHSGDSGHHGHHIGFDNVGVVDD